MIGSRLILTVSLFLFISCGKKENTKRELIKEAMDTGKGLYLNTLLNEIRTDSKYNKHTVDSIYEFRRDTILNNVFR